jgi:hypothetical protein
MPARCSVHHDPTVSCVTVVDATVVGTTVKVLCSAVLGFEALIVALAIPVALTLGSYNSRVVGWGGVVLALLCLVEIGILRRTGNLWLGHLLQIAILASGVVVPAMFILGVVFAALWICAVHFGRKADAIHLSRQAV